MFEKTQEKEINGFHISAVVHGHSHVIASVCFAITCIEGHCYMKTFWLAVSGMCQFYVV